MNYQEIKSLVSDGDIGEALVTLKSLVDNQFSELSNDVNLLLSEFNRFKRRQRIGLGNDQTVLRKIELAVLEVCDELESRSSNDSETPTKPSFESEARHLQVIIDIQKGNIRRTWIFAILLIVLGIILLFLTHSGLISADKTIMTIASTLIASISGFPINSINQKYGTIKTFKYFRELFLQLANGEIQIENEELERMKTIIWETLGKSATNAYS